MVVNPPRGDGYSTTGYYSATWTGIGGGLYTGNPLIQAGSDQNLSAIGVATYYFWYEIVGGPSDTLDEIRVSSPIAHPGDDVGSATIWLQSTTSVEFGICDFSDATPPGGCMQFYVTCKPNKPSTCTPQPGNSVEWIMEAPEHDDVQSNLADFGAVDFYNNCWSSTFTAGAPVGCDPIDVPGLPSPIAMLLGRPDTFGCYQILAHPSALGTTQGSTFNDVYQLPDPGCGQRH